MADEYDECPCPCKDGCRKLVSRDLCYFCSRGLHASPRRKAMMAKLVDHSKERS